MKPIAAKAAVTGREVVPAPEDGDVCLSVLQEVLFCFVLDWLSNNPASIVCSHRKGIYVREKTDGLSAVEGSGETFSPLCWQLQP